MANPDSRSDAELLRLSVEGDESAFLLLYDRLKHNIFRYSYFMTGSNFIAEEITQEVFMALLQPRGKYRKEQGDVAAFAFGIAKNFIRRTRRREHGFETLLGKNTDLACAADSVPAQIARNEVVDRVQMAVATLPLHYREAVVLCDFCELTYAEAATRLRCSVGTIRSRLNRAHTVLARKLKPLQGTSTVSFPGTEGCLI